MLGMPPLSSKRTSSAPRQLVSYLWESFLSVIPRSLVFGSNSEHFFDTVNIVFRTIDSEGQTKMDLDAYSQSWCKLLLEHTHAEVCLKVLCKFANVTLTTAVCGSR